MERYSFNTQMQNGHHQMDLGTLLRILQLVNKITLQLHIEVYL